ncbi:MAG: type I-E CRISPR-associated protein Cas6/Cse3/CasE [Bryobacterales bacterium]|nr:type I-E CRISPR-associated protein Cas6/Cse3/CasE [Bryobacterales bacterium]
MTVYLSRLLLNALNRAVQRDLADCQQLHRTLMKAFPPREAGAAARREYGLLYRMEAGNSSARQLLVQSALRPDWSFLPAGYLCPGSAPECKPVSEVYGRISTGERFRFRLRANPTRKISVDDASRPEGWRPMRVELRGETNWIQWLERKGGQHGFRLLAVQTDGKVPDLRTAPGGQTLGWRRAPGQAGGRAQSCLTLFAVLYDGRLEVTDPGLFQEGLASGIGPGKAYGFGLLSIARGG